MATIAEAIRTGSASSPLGGVPSGELYAVVMGTMNLESYNRVIGLLKGAGLVEEKNLLLRWIGPKL